MNKFKLEFPKEYDERVESSLKKEKEKLQNSLDHMNKGFRMRVLRKVSPIKSLHIAFDYNILSSKEAVITLDLGFAGTFLKESKLIETLEDSFNKEFGDGIVKITAIE